jgi:hypothetical protein
MVKIVYANQIQIFSDAPSMTWSGLAPKAVISCLKVFQHFDSRQRFGTYRMIEIHIGRLNHGVSVDNKTRGHR